MFSDRLMHLRDKVGLTQEELSKRLGMARTTYQGYENGKREPDLQTLEKIASYYNITVDDLLGRESKEYPLIETDADKMFLEEYLSYDEKKKEKLRKLMGIVREE